MTVVIHFNNESDVEVTHHVEGMTFLTFGRHPDLWSVDGHPVEIFSDTMPRTPDASPELARWIMEVVPPVRPRSGRPSPSR
ncbi:hypothetical protein [Alloactinosynnema sp. L-07]|uniref:hypothetical protein n=1 Tax=Alloactinosynnema sp. L-07 TaxID=1653480 RepID=UPI00065F0814|nr:hypothetical protein [Alloactinosynnema sp. L-07]CRK60389.1 hypothetical protein [Alloactinosynnema sp. L-07]